MVTIRRKLKRWEKKFDKKAEEFAFKHPYLASLIVFIGVPAFTLTAVLAVTAIVTLPIAALFGWM